MKKLGCFTIVFLSMNAYAEEAKNSSVESKVKYNRAIEEVIVTAQKRDQDALEVPMAITAFSGKMLEDMGAKSLKDIASATPSFSVVESGPGVQQLQMRGISSVYGKSTVGYQLNNVSLTSFSVTQPDAATFDLASVEILRGPQGTLYGEGSMGGTIKLVTQKPKLNEWEGIVLASSYSTKSADPGFESNVAFNIPINDSIATRLVGGWADIGGYIDQVEIGVKNHNEQKKKNGRAELLWQLSDNLVLDFMILAGDIDAGSVNAADEDYKKYDGVDVGIADKSLIRAIDATWDTSYGSFVISVSDFDRDNEVIFDSREVVVSELETGISLLDPPLKSIAEQLIKGSPSGYTISTESEMAEIRYISPTDNSWIITAGGNIRNFHEVNYLQGSIFLDQSIIDQLSAIGLPIESIFGQITSSPTSDAASVSILNITTDSDSTTDAIFGQLEYSPFNWLTATIGARYFREEILVETNGDAAAMDASSRDKLNFDSLTKRFSLSFFSPEDLFGFIDQGLFYVTYAEGFRSGGTNIQVNDNIPPTYDPDELSSYEFGTKLVFSGGKIIVESSIFYNDWRDVQVLIRPDNAGPFTAIDNVGNTEGTGIDLSISLSPLQGLSITLAGSKIDTEYVTNGESKNKGDPVDFVSPETASLGIGYRFDIRDSLPVFTRLDYRYSEKSVYQRNGSFFYESDKVELLNAKIGLEYENHSVYLFGNNLTNFDGALDANKRERQARARPLTVGIEAKVTF